MAGHDFDVSQYRWEKIEGGPELSYPMHYEYTVLGYDREAGTLDMLLRFDREGGHCARHRHVTTTTVLVLEGEQHLDDLLPNGERKHKVRKAGGYHLTTGDVLPHMERGGDEGALVFYSHHSPDGRMYEILGDDLEVLHVVTLDEMISNWESGAS